MVVWTSEGQDGSSGGIFAQRLAADGSLIGNEFQVNTTTDGNQQLPTVAVSPGGNFLVAWQGFELTDGEWKTYVQAFDANATSVGTEAIAGAGRHASATMSDQGDFVVAWEAASVSEASRKEIHVQHFSPPGCRRWRRDGLLDSRGLPDCTIDRHARRRGSHPLDRESR